MNLGLSLSVLLLSLELSLLGSGELGHTEQPGTVACLEEALDVGAKTVLLRQLEQFAPLSVGLRIERHLLTSSGDLRLLLCEHLSASSCYALLVQLWVDGACWHRYAGSTTRSGDERLAVRQKHASIGQLRRLLTTIGSHESGSHLLLLLLLLVLRQLLLLLVLLKLLLLDLLCKLLLLELLVLVELARLVLLQLLQLLELL